ncbi:mannosyl-oligosaccharide alpha-1,2-mannosidase [Rhizoctonia solani AG-1 IB]|uniref:alpha-1,2-Mannosidase n=1 Tax=Thanatephorus cucumeris (strain AG1-IB / isolate 7/3/14) TaxID=1108050 RepID=M5BK87_THACB|nr:mannosyl-oligosaccharide alpha-1,2-mannosidase [Rhizoctonia solani AG-1 IB]
MRARALLLSFVATAHALSIQKPDLQLPPEAGAKAKDAIELFTSAYADYKKYAWGNDSLAPITKAAVNDRNGWGATIVDAMSTMKIMGLEDLFLEAVDFSSKIDFSRSKTPDKVSLFETTIRYLGGMLSAYELGGKKNETLIDRSRELGDKLVHAWVGLNDIPYNNLDFSTDTPVLEQSGIAVAGTLVLEWSKLTEYTGNSTYRDLTERAMRRIGTNDSPLPGLPAQGINPSTGKPAGDYITWGGGSDSYFEYLIKYGRLTNNASPEWTSRWLTAVDSSIRYLAQTAVNTSVPDLLYLGDYTQNRVRHISSHLACFHGGNWIMGGRLTGNDTIVQYGLRLTDACWNSYEKTATGIGPEVFAYIGPDGNWTGSTSAPDREDLDFYRQNGFYIYSGYSYYDLRPEVLESNFYAWRATGDLKYFNRAVDGLNSIKKYCMPGVAVDGIWDVRSRNSSYINHTESFFFAEVMKYIYLTFDHPEKYSLDKYVFNTEAHPFEAPPPTQSFQPSQQAKMGEHLVSTPWTSEVPQISNAPGINRKLSDVVQQGL